MASLASRSPLRDWSRGLAYWLGTAAGRRVGVAAMLIGAGLLLFATGDKLWLGLPFVREEAPRFDLYHLGQSLFAFAASAFLVASLVRARSVSAALDTEPLRRWEIGAGLASLAAAASGAGLFLADPPAFHAFAQEDRPLEWASALLLLAAAAVFAWHALRRRREPVTVLLALGLCLVLFLVGMEEISWGQRVFGFATPESLAEMNWQAEFNLHNVQTDLSETVYYFGAAVFLLLLPLLRDLLPRSVAAHPWLGLAPGRSVALVSAPVALFNYGHWDLLAIQLTILLALWSMFAWSRAARGQGDRGAASVWLIAALFVVAGQALFLALGHRQVDVPDVTEYKEFFIGLGLAWYAATVTLRRRPEAGRRQELR